MSNYKVLKLVIQTDNVVVIGNVWFSNAIWYAMNIFSGIIHKWISQHLTEHWWTLFQCCQATSHYQSQYGPRSMLSMVSLSPNDLNLPITQCIGFELAQGTQYLALMCNILIFFPWVLFWKSDHSKKSLVQYNSYNMMFYRIMLPCDFIVSLWFMVHKNTTLLPRQH